MLCVGVVAMYMYWLPQCDVQIYMYMYVHVHICEFVVTLQLPQLPYNYLNYNYLNWLS